MSEVIEEFEFIRINEDINKIDLIGSIKMSTKVMADFVKSFLSNYLFHFSKNRRFEFDGINSDFFKSSIKHYNLNYWYIWVVTMLSKGNLKLIFNSSYFKNTLNTPANIVFKSNDCDSEENKKVNFDSTEESQHTSINDPSKEDDKVQKIETNTLVNILKKGDVKKKSTKCVTFSNNIIFHYIENERA